MPNPGRRNCTCCGKPDTEVGPISWQGNCLSCGELLLKENIVGIAEKSGPAYRRRLRGYAKWLDRVAVDEPAHSP